MIADEKLKQFKHDGFLVFPKLFSKVEIDLLRERAKSDHQMDQHAYGRGDGEGGNIRLSLWNQPGDGIYGTFARSRRLVEVAEALLGEEPYHYHSKMIMKDAKIGGAWAWHQDYGYWYQNAVLKPNLVSAFIAVDPSTKQNGCLQVIERSHHYDRIEHVLTGEQAGANLERVAQIQRRETLTYVEMEPGDVIFFHANLLHRSDQNNSDKPRWSMICCYNAKSNEPYEQSRHPFYSPIDVVEDDAILKFSDSHPDRLMDGNSSSMAWHQSTSPSAANLELE